MSPRSFFMIVVRIVGITLLINVLTSLPTTTSSLSALMMHDDNDRVFATVSLIIFIAMMAMVMFLIIYFLMMKPGKLIHYFKLDAGFEEEKFELNLSQSTVIRLAIIIVSGIALLYEIPKFVQELFIFWQQKRIWWVESPETKYLIFSGVIIIIAYFLIYYNEKIAQYIEKKSNEQSENL